MQDQQREHEQAPTSATEPASPDTAGEVVETTGAVPADDAPGLDPRSHGPAAAAAEQAQEREGLQAAPVETLSPAPVPATVEQAPPAVAEPVEQATEDDPGPGEQATEDDPGPGEQAAEDDPGPGPQLPGRDGPAVGPDTGSSDGGADDALPAPDAGLPPSGVGAASADVGAQSARRPAPTLDAALVEATAFGRVEDGRVLVRTDAGDREVGTWEGDPVDGLRHYARGFADLEVRVALLEQRLGGAAKPGQVREQARRLQSEVQAAQVVGDLDGLAVRLTTVMAAADAASALVRRQREQEGREAHEHRERLVAEAEELATSQQWKATGERYTALLEEWKTIRAGDRETAQQLWQRFSAARRRFTERRGEHFKALDAQRGQARSAKEALVAEAESLATSTDWDATSRAMAGLMRRWKEAPRGDRRTEDAQWKRFRAAQDAFFAARGQARSAEDAALEAVVAVKEELLPEAERIDAGKDPQGAQSRLRDVQKRWDAAGRVPRAAYGPLEDRLRAVEERVRDATASRLAPARGPGDVMLEKLRAQVAELREQAERARGAGDERRARDAEQQLSVKQMWLDSAERAGGRRR